MGSFLPFTFSFLSLMLNWRLCHLRRGDSICAEAGRAGLFVRYAQPRKRLAARSFARARRAVGGFAGKPASTLGHASAMRCVAANRHGSPLRGTQNFTEKPHIGLMHSQENSLQAFFRGIQCRAKPASVSAGRGGDAAHRKGWVMAAAMLAWTVAIPCPQAANGGPPRQRLPWSRASAPALSAAGPTACSPSRGRNGWRNWSVPRCRP